MVIFTFRRVMWVVLHPTQAQAISFAFHTNLTTAPARGNLPTNDIARSVRDCTPSLRLVWLTHRISPDASGKSSIR
jgi:hypothetical protein